MTFFITVMCGNRLNCWNTRPKRERAWASVALSPYAAEPPSPARATARSPYHSSPASRRSSSVMQRKSVDLPPPDGPMIATTSPGVTSSVMSLSTWLSPKLLLACSRRTRGFASDM